MDSARELYCFVRRRNVLRGVFEEGSGPSAASRVAEEGWVDKVPIGYCLWNHAWLRDRAQRVATLIKLDTVQLIASRTRVESTGLTGPVVGAGQTNLNSASRRRLKFNLNSTLTIEPLSIPCPLYLM